MLGGTGPGRGGTEPPLSPPTAPQHRSHPPAAQRGAALPFQPLFPPKVPPHALTRGGCAGRGDSTGLGRGHRPHAQRCPPAASDPGAPPQPPPRPPRAPHAPAWPRAGLRRRCWVAAALGGGAGSGRAADAARSRSQDGGAGGGLAGLGGPGLHPCSPATVPAVPSHGDVAPGTESAPGGCAERGRPQRPRQASSQERCQPHGTAAMAPPQPHGRAAAGTVPTGVTLRVAPEQRGPQNTRRRRGWGDPLPSAGLPAWPGTRGRGPARVCPPRDARASPDARTGPARVRTAGRRVPAGRSAGG